MKQWNEKNKLEKISDIIAGIALCVWLVFEAMDRKGIVAWADIASRISVIVICIFEGISFWNDRRVLSYVAIAGVVVLLATFVLEFMLLA